MKKIIYAMGTAVINHVELSDIIKKIIYAFMANSTSKFCLWLWRRNTSGNVL